MTLIGSDGSCDNDQRWWNEEVGKDADPGMRGREVDLSARDGGYGGCRPKSVISADLRVDCILCNREELADSKVVE